MTNTEKQIQIEQLYELKKGRTNHILHFIISLFTFGLWSVVWVLVSANTAVENYRLRSRLSLQ